MISSILVANRGEIAVRIVRACREMGIRSVVAYSSADRHSLAVRMADESVCIGPPAASASYLNVSNLVSAAVLSHCDAVHPGVGFLSENAAFAREVTEAGLVFIGPPAETISLLGDKVQAKKTAVGQQVPVIPGSAGSVTDADAARKAASEIGYPVIVKAASGGGGKGMRICHREEDLAGVLQIASAEAEKSFSDGTVYLEKYLTSPRHVELQVIADSHGNVVHLGERTVRSRKTTRSSSKRVLRRRWTTPFGRRWGPTRSGSSPPSTTSAPERSSFSLRTGATTLWK
jgi:acetyl-CoA carboxylase biotin carboxylase subunit